MSRVAPEARAIRFAFVRRIFPEFMELVIGKRFARDTNEPDRRANHFDSAQWRAGVQACQQERQRQNHIEQSLKFEKKKKAQGQVRYPFLVKPNVTTLLRLSTA